MVGVIVAGVGWGVEVRSLVPARNAPEKDNVLTPPSLALSIVRHYNPTGTVYDPCAGDGAFVTALRTAGAGHVHHAETRVAATHCNGKDFFKSRGTFDWIVSNPPYSILTPWLVNSFIHGVNIVYLIQPPAAFFTAKRRAAHDAGFGICEIHYVNCPEEWKAAGISFGAGLGAVHWQRGYTGAIRETYQDGYVWPKKGGGR